MKVAQNKTEASYKKKSLFRDKAYNSSAMLTGSTALKWRKKYSFSVRAIPKNK